MRLGTRGSELALAQARLTARLLAERAGVEASIDVIETDGDRRQDEPIAALGVKGVFTAELEAALRAGRIDAAVHSLKDLPVDDPPGLVVAAIPERVAAHDVLVLARRAHAAHGAGGVPLREGARIGTSSPRRTGALRVLRPDLDLFPIRGNVPTRVQKVRRGDCDGVVLAAAGIARLGLDLSDLVVTPLPEGACPPAPGQGALAVQCRADDAAVRALLARIDDPAAGECARAERELLRALGGGCSMPLGAAAVRGTQGGYELRAALFAGDGGAGVFRSARGRDLAALVAAVAEELAPLVGAPLQGADVVLVRPDGARGELGEFLAVAGACVRAVALTEFEPIDPGLRGLARCAGAPALAFTSARGVARFFDLVTTHALECRPARVFAVGARTAAALAERGVRAEVPARPGGGAQLAAHVLSQGARGEIGFPCAEDRDPELERVLAAAGVAVTALPVYRTRARAGASADDFGLSIVVLTSPSGVRAYQATARGTPHTLVAFGARTAAATTELGLRVAATAEETTPSALLTAISEVMR